MRLELTELPDCVIETVPVLREQEIPVPEPPDIEVESVTVPVKPERLDTTTVREPELPETSVVDELEEVMPKSPTLNATMIRWDTDPPVAFTTKLYEPGSVEDDAAMDIAENPEPPGTNETWAWLNDAEIEEVLAGMIEEESET